VLGDAFKGSLGSWEAAVSGPGALHYDDAKGVCRSDILLVLRQAYRATARGRNNRTRIWRRWRGRLRAFGLSMRARQRLWVVGLSSWCRQGRRLASVPSGPRNYAETLAPVAPPVAGTMRMIGVPRMGYYASLPGGKATAIDKIGQNSPRDGHFGEANDETSDAGAK
jgi:hypothetical protein